LAEARPDIISVGDSSGFHSVQPTIVNRYTHGLKYVNLNIGSNQAFDGYKAIADDSPPLKWSDLRYVFDIKEDCNGKEAIQA
jgi:hypothetical protein